MKKAKFVKEITVVDPDTKGDVQISIYKHENGGLFGMDSSFLDQCTDEDSYPIIPDPFNDHAFVGSEGVVMLVEDNQISNFIESVDLNQE
jgi:hypothetical protein